jgi:hypothetical protein
LLLCRFWTSFAWLVQDQEETNSTSPFTNPGDYCFFPEGWFENRVK